MTGDPLDELFHWAGLVAFLEVANERRAWPDSEEVRVRAFDLYEAELKEKNAGRQQVLDRATTLGHIVETTPRRDYESDYRVRERAGDAPKSPPDV